MNCENNSIVGRFSMNEINLFINLAEDCLNLRRAYSSPKLRYSLQEINDKLIQVESIWREKASKEYAANRIFMEFKDELGGYWNAEKILNVNGDIPGDKTGIYRKFNRYAKEFTERSKKNPIFRPNE